MNKKKIVVYAICKNEEKFVERWIKSMSEADEIYVLDTGSTDQTVTLLKKFGAKVKIKNIFLISVSFSNCKMLHYKTKHNYLYIHKPYTFHHKKFPNLLPPHHYNYTYRYPHSICNKFLMSRHNCIP